MKISKNLSCLGICFLVSLLFVSTPKVAASSETGLYNNINSQSSEAVPGTIWSHSYGGPYREGCSSLIEVSTGGFAMIGVYCQTNPYVPLIWLVRTDSNGNHLWNRTYTNITSYSSSLVECSDGGFALAGSYEFLDPVTQILYLRGWLIRTNADGNQLWNLTFGEYADYCTFSEIAECSDDGFIIFGHIRLTGGSVDYYLARTDSDGNLLWEKSWGSDEDDYAGLHGLSLCGDDGFILIGSPSLFLMRTDGEGNQLWNQTYSNIEGNCILSLDDGFLVAGRSVTEMGAYEGPVLLRTNDEGNLIWKRKYGHQAIRIGTHTMSASGNSIVRCSTGGFSIAGFCYGPIGPNFWLMRTDENGVYLWDQEYILNEGDEARDVIEASDGGFVMAGYTLKESDPYNSDILLMKVADQPLIESSRWLSIGLGVSFAIFMTILVLWRRKRWSEQ